MENPHTPHPGPESDIYRPSPPHRLEARSTSLLGMAISRWEACRDRRSVQQRRGSKVYIMTTYTKLVQPPLRDTSWGDLACSDKGGYVALGHKVSPGDVSQGG